MWKRRVRGVLGIVCASAFALGCGNVTEPREPNGSGGAAGSGDAGESGSAALGGNSGIAGGGSGGGNHHSAGSGGMGGDAGAGDDAGAGGDAGSAGSPSCSVLEARFCDDGNDCTVDECGNAGCHHIPASDGAACDDGSACTALDQCHDGTCVGTPQTSTPEVLGEVVSFGTYDAHATENQLQHLVVALSERDLVFAESVATGMEVKLVHVENGHSQLVNRIFSYASLGVATGEYHDDTASHLVRVSSSRVALISSNYVIELFDLVDGQLVRGNWRQLPNDGVTARLAGAVAKDDQLWLNDGQNLYSYDISANGTLTPFVHVANSSVFPSIALSDDGNTLYLAGTKGVFTFDTTDRHNPIVNRTAVIAGNSDWQPIELHVHGGYLWLQTMGVLTEIGEGRLFRTDTYQPLLTVSGATAPSLPLGAALGDGKLLLQRLQLGANQASQLVAQLYSLSDGAATLSAEYSYRDLGRFQDDASWQPYPPALFGSLAVLEPIGSLVDLSSDAFHSITGVEQGQLDRVRYVGNAKFSAYGPDATHLIDAASPAVPRLMSGGSLAVGVGSQQCAAVASGLTGASVFSDGHGFNSLLTRFSAEDSQAPRFIDDIQLETPDFVLTTASDHGLLFRVTGRGSGASPQDLEVIDLEAARSSKPLAPLEKVNLFQAFSTLTSPRLAVDVAAQTLVLVGSDPARNYLSTVAWFSRSSGNWQFTSKLELDFEAYDLLVRGDRAALITGDRQRLVLLGRAADRSVSLLVQRAFATGSEATLGVDRLLGIDGNRIYAATAERDAELPGHAGVVAFDLADLHDVAHYGVTQVAKSMAAGQGMIALGSRDRVITLSPACN